MDEAEATKLYERYGYFLFRRCLIYLGDSASAQDAVRAVFVRALRTADGAREQAAPRTWLCRIADQHCIDALRLHDPRPTRELGTSLAAALDVSRDVSRAPDIEADDSEGLLAVRRLLAQLEPDARRLAVLYYVDELTQEELAHALGLSRSAVEKRIEALLAQARSVLREQAAV